MKASNTVRTVRRRFTQCAAIYNAGEEVVSINAKTLQGNVVARRITSPSSAGNSIHRAGLPSPAEPQLLVYASPTTNLSGNDIYYHGLDYCSALKSKLKRWNAHSWEWRTKFVSLYHGLFQAYGNGSFGPKVMEGS